MNVCKFCSDNFSRKDALKRHIINKKCSFKNTDKLWNYKKNH